MLPRPPVKLVVGLIALAFFFAPAVAWVAGDRAKPIENRPLTPFPSFDRGFGIFKPLTQWTNDHLPLRATAVRVNTRVSRRVFGELPAQADQAGPVGIGQSGRIAGVPSTPSKALSPQFARAVPGRNGWLFLSDDFIYACQPQFTIAEVVRGLRRLDSIIRHSGRRLIVAAPPDKSAFEPSKLPGSYPGLSCIAPAYRARTAALRGLRAQGVVDLAASLAAQQRRQGSPVFLSDDTHWSETGAMVYARLVAGAIDSRLTVGNRVVSVGPQKYIGDLTRLAGDPRSNTQTGLRLVRRGVGAPQISVRNVYPGGDIRRLRRRAAPGAARLFPGRTVVYGDSFASAYGGLDFLATFFEDIAQAPELYAAATVHRLPQAENALIGLIKGSRVFVYEQVERQLWGVRVASVLRPEFLDKLERALKRP